MYVYSLIINNYIILKFLPNRLSKENMTSILSCPYVSFYHGVPFSYPPDYHAEFGFMVHLHFQHMPSEYPKKNMRSKK